MMNMEDESFEPKALPQKIVEKILSYLHPKQLRACASISRDFYQAVILMETNACIVLKTKEAIDEFDSIIQTSRTIHNIRVGSIFSPRIVCTKYCYDALLAIFSRHGPNLRNITFENVRIAKEDLKDLIGCCVQYQRLVLQWVDSHIEAQSLVECGIVNLCSKEIVVKFCDEKIQKIILTLPTDTVYSIEFLCNTNVHLKQFFKQQNTLKKISARFYHDHVNFSCLQYNKIESLDFGSYGNQASLLSLMLTQMNNMQHLDLTCATINDLLFTTATNMFGLRSFKVSLNGISAAAFLNIYKLDQLDDLTLMKNDKNHEAHLGTLANWPNKRLRKLELLFPTTFIRNEVYRALAFNFGLQDFHISSIVTQESVLEVINNSHSTLRTLKIHDPNDFMKSSLEMCATHNILLAVNENLRELSLRVDSEFILIALEIFPNLQKLELETMSTEHELFELIFTKLRQLTDLRIVNKFAIGLQGLYMRNLLRQHGHRFKYISMFALTAPLEQLQSIYEGAFVEIKQSRCFTELLN